MIPQKTDKKWEDLVTGKVNHNFKCFPLGMLISRHKRIFQRDNSKEAVNKLIDEAHDFFIQYESILQDDIKSIFS